MWYGGKIRRILIKLGKRFPRRSFSRFPSSFSICLEPNSLVLSSCQTLVFFFQSLPSVVRYPCNSLSNASSRDHFRDPFFHGIKKKTPSRRSHSASKTVSNIIPRESRIHAFWQREDIFPEKSYRSFLSRKVTFPLLI